jgi:hypothetical protein
MAYYPTGCDEQIESHICGGCGIELARIRRGAFVNQSYYATLAADIDNINVWNAGITSGEIIVLPEIQGEYDGGAPQMGQGYGDVEERLNSYLFTAQIKDPQYVNNRGFYNSIKRSRRFHFAFASETVIKLTQVPCTIVPTNPIANDLKAEVTWDVQVKWTNEDFPIEGTVIEEVFTCYVP